MESFIPGPEQEAEEILVEQGFAEPEDLEPEMAELLKDISKRIRELGVKEVHQLLSRYEWIREAMFGEDESPNG